MKLSVNGVELATEVHGARTDPVVVLIHGAGQNLLAWPDEFVRWLVDGGRCVVRFDLRDAGRSTSYPIGAPGYTLRDMVADTAALLDALHIGRAGLVGMSGGAALAQLMALEHPARVTSLTLMSSTPGGPGHEYADLPSISESLQSFFAAEGNEPDWNDRAAVIAYLVDAERPFAASSRPFDEHSVQAMSERSHDYTANIAAQLTNPFLLDAGEPWRDLLGQISVPTLVIHGTEDPFFPIGHGRALAAEIPGSRLIELTATGHEIAPREHWDVVIPAILKQTGAPAGGGSAR